MEGEDNVEGEEKVGGTRYSVIYYLNRPRHGTERTFAVDESWTPTGAGGSGGGELSAADGSASSISNSRGKIGGGSGAVGGRLVAACSVAVCGFLMAARKLR